MKRMNCIARFLTVFHLVWNYFKLMPQLVIGGWKISRIPHPAVTIFGGGRLSRDSHYMHMASEIARRLSDCHISVITGGGPGIMEAANCGAIRRDLESGRTMGVAVHGVNTNEPINPCVTDYFETDYFALRKHLLIYYAHAFIIFPGGFGTLDEFFEVLTLMQTKKIPVMPVVLVGKAYWRDLIGWIKKSVEEGLVPPEHAKYIHITDQVDEVVNFVADYCSSPLCESWQHRDII